MVIWGLGVHTFGPEWGLGSTLLVNLGLGVHTFGAEWGLGLTLLMNFGLGGLQGLI